MGDIILVEGPNELNVQMVPVAVARFVYVSPLTVISGDYELDAWVDIQNQGEVAGECTVSWYMREYHAGYDMWSAWSGPWGPPPSWIPETAILQPGEVRRFSWFTEFSAMLSQQIMVESPAGILLEPPEPGL